MACVEFVGQLLAADAPFEVGVTQAHDALRAAGHAALGREAIAGQADLLDVQLGALGGRAQTHELGAGVLVAQVLDLLGRPVDQAQPSRADPVLRRSRLGRGDVLG